MSETKSW